jgi:polyphosphate glucokinase
MRFDYEQAFGAPVKIVNDAAMQALGAYAGGRMLFLRLGTGLGSALVAEGLPLPLELGHLPYRRGRTYEDYVGIRGFVRLGRRKWTRHVHTVVELLQAALQADYVVLGGGQCLRGSATQGKAKSHRRRRAEQKTAAQKQ